jgi:hypothetical protein
MGAGDYKAIKAARYGESLDNMTYTWAKGSYQWGGSIF